MREPGLPPPPPRPRWAAVPVGGRGDVGWVGDAGACLAASGAAAVMVGRSAVGRPWLVGQIGAALGGRRIRDPAPNEMTAIAVEHYEGLLALYGEKVGVRHARKHLAAYADVALAAGFSISPAVRSALVTSEDPKAVV